jgi:hypothetical protein
MFATMKENESVKIDKFVVDLVRENRGITGVPVSKFFEQAATAKLEKEKIISMPVKKGKK